MQQVILVVEQNPNVRDMITHVLRRGGFLVIAATDGTTAIDVARLNPIALMIIDPESLQSGWPDLCRQLHTYDEMAHIPILMMVTSEDEFTQIMRDGPRVSDFMMRSFVWEELRGRVQSLLRGSKRIQKVILLVEQDAALRDTITDSLRREGYLVLAVTADVEAIGVARHSPISLIILDPTSPQSGIETCHRLRACDETARVPILMMATNEVEIAQMVRLNPGVNDFIVKPFPWEELRACVYTLLRGDRGRVRQKRVAASPKRKTTYKEGEILVTDTLRIDLGQHRVTRGEQQIKLGNGLLFDLLVYLVRHRGDVLTRDQMLKQVWCREVEQDMRTVDVHVHWLRQKLHDNLDNPQLIQTVPGMGYRFTG